MEMNANRAKELLVPLKKGKAEGISKQWADRLIEALEYVIEIERRRTPCPECGKVFSHYTGCSLAIDPRVKK